MINICGKPWEKIRLKDIEKYLKEIEDDETFFLEYKEENITHHQLSKELCAFSNTYGGYLLLGVDDDKRIIGCSKWTELRISDVIYGHISPVPHFDIKKFKLKNNKKLFIIKVEEGSNPPYITNSGQIFQRISSKSEPIKDAFSLNRLYYKKNNFFKELEYKLYFNPIQENLINNLCGYLDFGFSISYKDKNGIINRIKNINYEDLVEVIKNDDVNYSISRIGNLLNICVGNVSVSNFSNKVLKPEGLNNFMEILPDGSFRCRVVFISNNNDGIADVSSIIYINFLFRKIYEFIFGDKIISNYVESFKYEKLVVLKQFCPKFLCNDDMNLQFEKYYNNQYKKYGVSTVLSSNRVPQSGFIIMDKRKMMEFGIKFNSENLYNHLFFSTYCNLGFNDDFKND